MGCIFIFFNLLVVGLFFFAAAWVARFIGGAYMPAGAQSWLLPVGLGLLIFVSAVIGMGMFGLRRVFTPLDDMLEAAGRVAVGDYSARVNEKGPAEVRSLARAFNNMAARLSQTDENRRNLLADVTHELRTPLTVIQGNLEGMLDGLYEPDEANLGMLLEETNLLARLVEDLRTLALAESGALELKKEPTDIEMLIRDSLPAFQTQAQTAGVKLVFEAARAGGSSSGETAFILDIDPARIRQVLLNLVSNALRYSPNGGSVIVKCAAVADYFVVEVSDDGPGIPTADLPHIFERFYKSSDSGGMGLGLAIARYLVTAHGGLIEAQSVPGKGSTIRISLALGDSH
jgi:signal transduction histidine kinase